MLASFWRYPDATRAARYTVIGESTVDDDCDGLRIPRAFVVLDEDAYAFKRVTYLDHRRRKSAVLALILPAGAVVHLSNTKCRATEAYVLAATDSHKRNLLHWSYFGAKKENDEIHKGFLADGTREYTSLHLVEFKYYVGDFVVPAYDFCGDFEVCSDGIHCFRTYRAAFNY